jgi:seryl-tRNA synthetase
MTMWPREAVVRALSARGELWDVAPGVTALRGDAAELLRKLEHAISGVCALETSDDWRVPPAIDFATLARAEYFASFPHWLTLASHLRDEDDALCRVAECGEPMVLREASAPPQAALNPAVCYHVYAALAGQVIDSARLVTAQSACWRHEGSRHATLERGWAFTMREIVCIGSDGDARAFLERSTERVTELARALDLDPTVALATDPFFAPSARAKHVLQRLKELKHELLLPVSASSTIAASSFNLHDTFFGEAFAIRLPDGRPATTACVAFGLERWLLAFLVRHGADASAWPRIPLVGDLAEVRHGSS